MSSDIQPVSATNSFTEEELNILQFLRKNPNSASRIFQALYQSDITTGTISSSSQAHQSPGGSDVKRRGTNSNKILSHILSKREGSNIGGQGSVFARISSATGSRVRQTVEKYEQLTSTASLFSAITAEAETGFPTSRSSPACSTNGPREDTSWLNRTVVDYDHTGQKQIESTEDLWTFVDLVRGLYDIEPDPINIASRIIDTAGAVISAEGCSLFLLDKKTNELYTRISTSSSSSPQERRIPVGKGIAGHVALTGEVVILPDERFNDQLDPELEKIPNLRTLMCLPIQDKDGILGVAQLINKKGNSETFDRRDEKRFSAFLSICGLSIRSALSFESLRVAQQKSELLLKLALKVSKQMASDAVSKEIIAQSRQMLAADRCALFLVDNESNPPQLYSAFFEDPNDQNSQKNEIRFNLDTGIAGFVATTGQPLNIPNAYEDSRFNREVDLATGYCTRSLLCMPLSYGKQIVGVAQLVNKQGANSFSQEDQEFFHAFAVYCGIALHKALLFERLLRSQQKNLVALELLSYHSTCSYEDVERLKSLKIPSAEELLNMDSFRFDPHVFKLFPFGSGNGYFSGYSFYEGDSSPPHPSGLTPPNSPSVHKYFQESEVPSSFTMNGEEAILCVVLRMFIDLGFVEKYNIPYETLCRWVLTVRKNYRRIPYHNFVHAVSVAHTVYVLIKFCGLHRYFEEHELLAMFIGSLCHDLDHRGTNNAFQKLAQTPLSSLYPSSILENHHFNHAIFILHSEGHNIFQNLSQDKYKSVLKFMEQNIIATDLANHFSSKNKLEKILCDFVPTPWDPSDTSQTFSSLFNPEDRVLLAGLLMTCSDLSNVTKPTPISKHIAKIVYSEFCQQGDIEKKLGVKPLPIMDRQKEAELPKMQVEFIDFVCRPAFDMLLRFLPETQPFIDGIMLNRLDWKSSLEVQ